MLELEQAGGDPRITQSLGPLSTVGIELGAKAKLSAFVAKWGLHGDAIDPGGWSVDRRERDDITPHCHGIDPGIDVVESMHIELDHIAAPGSEGQCSSLGRLGEGGSIGVDASLLQPYGERRLGGGENWGFKVIENEHTALFTGDHQALTTVL